MQQFMHLFKYRWNTAKVMKSHTLEISGTQSMLTESNSLPNANEASAFVYISLYFLISIKYCKISFFFSFIQVQGSWRPPGADVVLAIVF